MRNIEPSPTTIPLGKLGEENNSAQGNIRILKVTGEPLTIFRACENLIWKICHTNSFK